MSGKILLNVSRLLSFTISSSRIYSLFKNDKSEIIREDENKIYYIFHNIKLTKDQIIQLEEPIFRTLY